ncbi:MAG: NYN domain-containing protein [Cyanobacteria bacterium J06607_10]
MKLSDSNSANPAPKKQTAAASAGNSNADHPAKGTSHTQQADRSPLPTQSVTPPSAMKKVKETASSLDMQDNAANNDSPTEDTSAEINSKTAVTEDTTVITNAVGTNSVSDIDDVSGVESAPPAKLQKTVKTRKRSRTAATKPLTKPKAATAKGADKAPPASVTSASSSTSDDDSSRLTSSALDAGTSNPKSMPVNHAISATHRPFKLSANAQPVTHNSDRIAIFIDGSNLFYAASHLNIEVDYRRLLSSLVRGRRLLRAYFYTGVDPQNEKQRGFLLWLNRHGHRVVSKELSHMPDGSRKANMHVEMAVDMMRIAEYCPTLTLLGGDGNLAYALKVLSQRGTCIEVVSLQSMTSDSLIDLADSYRDLADLRDEIKR